MTYLVTTVCLQVSDTGWGKLQGPDMEIISSSTYALWAAFRFGVSPHHHAMLGIICSCFHPWWNLACLYSHHLCLKAPVQVASPHQNLINKHPLAKLFGACCFWGFFFCMYVFHWRNTTVCSVHIRGFISGYTLNSKSGEGKRIEMNFEVFISCHQSVFRRLLPCNNFWCTIKNGGVLMEGKHSWFYMSLNWAQKPSPALLNC